MRYLRTFVRQGLVTFSNFIGGGGWHCCLRVRLVGLVAFFLAFLRGVGGFFEFVLSIYKSSLLLLFGKLFHYLCI